MDNSKQIAEKWFWNPEQDQKIREIWPCNKGQINNAPRPQGRLPASNWLYKKELVPKDMIDFDKSNVLGSLTS